MKPQVAIVGGGASGLTAAIAAARSGAHVTILERNTALGRKVLASGGGRCNLTNRSNGPEHYHGGQTTLIREALAGLKSLDIVRFFNDLGLMTIAESDGRIFPRCGKAQAVIDVLKAELEMLGVQVRLGTEVNAVHRERNGFLLRTATAELKCDRMILACGSAAHPQLGAGEAAYGLAQSLGHTITELTPALVPLCVNDNDIKRLHGLRAQAGLRIFCDDAEVAHSHGEILFTDYGISGPATLDVSRAAVLHLARGRVRGSLNLFPEHTHPQLLALVHSRWNTRAHRPLKDFFLGMFPPQLTGAIIDALSWDAHRPRDTLGRQAPERVSKLLEDWRFDIVGSKSWSEAMTTAGGIALGEVNPKTFASRNTAGLYLTGEMLDVDGDSGGYNLHFAWASGWAAGRAASNMKV